MVVQRRARRGPAADKRERVAGEPRRRRLLVIRALRAQAEVEQVSVFVRRSCAGGIHRAGASDGRVLDELRAAGPAAKFGVDDSVTVPPSPASVTSTVMASWDVSSMTYSS